MFKLNQAISEGWSINGTPLAIVSVDPHKTDIVQRSHVFNQIMAGSAYHIEAFDIVRTQNAGAIARVPQATAGSRVKLTEAVTVQVEYEVPAVTRYDDEIDEAVEVEPARTETKEVTKPRGTTATVVSAAFDVTGGAFTLRFQDGSETSFDGESDQWFPFERVQTMDVVGSYGQLTVDKATGAVLDYRPEDGGSYEDIALIDVAELRRTLGDQLPDFIDIVLVGYTMKDGSREQPERKHFIETRLADANLDPVLLAFIKAELSLAA